MSTPAQAPAPALRWRGPHRLALLLGGAALVVGAVAVVALAAGDPETADRLDPANPGRDGTAALVAVLDEQGVEVEVARGAGALEASPVGTGTTVVVSPTGALGASTAERLRQHATSGLVVLLEPGPVAVDVLGTPPARVARPRGGVAAACAAGAGLPDGLADRLEGLVVDVDRPTAYDAPGCFPAGGGYLLVGGGAEVVLGAAGALTNDQVLRADNAALALRLLGGGDRVVWYVPDPADLSASDALPVSALLPDWLVPGLWLTAAAVLALALWRGRRLGRLAVEPLPVVVRAVETTRSRGGLYRRAGDRGHAAAALRTAARGRLSRRLGLGPVGGPAPLVAAAAAAAGRDPAGVAALLADDGPAPATDHDLTTLAQELDRLDREVRHP